MRYIPRGLPLEMLTIEVSFFIIIIALCAIILWKTKDLYKLSKHRGIYHFRNVFMFFTIAYGLRLIHLLGKISKELIGVRYPGLQPITLLLVGYFSTLAILSLAATTIYRHYKIDSEILLHCTALAFSLLIFITRSPGFLMIIQAGIFIIAYTYLLFKSDSLKDAVNQNHITYLMLFFFWILSLFAFTRGIPHFVKIVLYLLSAGVFFSIFYRVNKRLGHAKKR